MLRKHTLFLVVMIALVVSGCLGAGRGPLNATITVEVVDKYGHPLAAEVSLINPADHSIITSVTSSDQGFATFESVDRGVYALRAVHALSGQQATEVVSITIAEVSVKMELRQYASSASVEKYFFAPADEKTLRIPALQPGEKVILGVTPLLFNSANPETYTLGINLKREASTEAFVSQSSNPPYVYTPARQVSVPAQLPLKYTVDTLLRGYEADVIRAQDAPPLPKFGPAIYSLGDSRIFHQPDFEAPGQWFPIEAVVRGIGEHCIVFVDKDATYVTDAMVEAFIQEMDSKIFPNNTGFFGPGFDIDQNNKVGIVLNDMRLTDFSRGGIGGYFYGVDFYPDELVHTHWGLRSNEGDFIYINAQLLDPNLFGLPVEDTLNVIAHEFQHLQYFYRGWEKGWLFSDDWVPDTWINEGMSTFAERLNGYDSADSFIYIYFDDANVVNQRTDGPFVSKTSLTYWSQELANYGIVYLFGNYLAEQYGTQVMQAMYEQARNPISVIESFVPGGMKQIFMNFIIANKLHSLNLAPEYTYTMRIEGDPSHSPLTSVITTGVVEMRPAAVKYYEIHGTGEDVVVTFSGSATNMELGVFTYRY